MTTKGKCVDVHMSMYVCIYVCMYVCVCIFLLTFSILHYTVILHALGLNIYNVVTYISTYVQFLLVPTDITSLLSVLLCIRYCSYLLMHFKRIYLLAKFTNQLSCNTYIFNE